MKTEIKNQIINLLMSYDSLIKRYTSVQHKEKVKQLREELTEDGLRDYFTMVNNLTTEITDKLISSCKLLPAEIKEVVEELQNENK